jgi:hypothetical protein
MTIAEIRVLKENQDREVEIRCTDGEVMQVKVLLVSESECDVIYDLISTNRPERYPIRPEKVCYATAFRDIETISPRSAAPGEIGSLGP